MGVVIIGAGHAGVQTADSLRQQGYDGPLTILSAESSHPYQRPPLSKDYLVPGGKPEPLGLRGESFFTDQDITLVSNVRAQSIDTKNHLLHSTAGSFGYDDLVIATGARNRNLDCQGSTLPGVYGLKTLRDAAGLHSALETAREVTVVGAGFIGLEFASLAHAHGCRVTVLEHSPRPMGRALSQVMSGWFARMHQQRGIDLRLGEGISHFEAGDAGRMATAVASTGERYPSDLAVVGIGVIPNDELARDAGLSTDNGILVDSSLQTSDPHVFAVGDCARYPSLHAGSLVRLESVQNATDQAKHVAGVIMGTASSYSSLPWFWSVQGKCKLQIAGLIQPDDETLVLGAPDADKFSVLCFREDRLVAVESVNSPADHLAARKILSTATLVTKEQAHQPGFTLKAASRPTFVMEAA